MRDHDCVAFLQWALPRLRMRWPGFRKVRRQVCRRIARRMAEREIVDLDDYRRLLEEDAAEWDALDALCRVTISRFFRDRGVYEGLGRVVLPDLATRALAAGRDSLGAWSAGCASGEEPYGLAILWALLPETSREGLALEIIATDTDSHLLERARRARYPPGAVRELPTDGRRLAFEESDGELELRPVFRSGIDFRLEDLRRTAPAGPFDLVLCRNLAFTYYAPDLQGEVLRRIATVLRPGGVLVVGCHEAPPESEGFEPVPDVPSCYRLG